MPAAEYVNICVDLAVVLQHDEATKSTDADWQIAILTPAATEGL